MQGSSLRDKVEKSRLANEAGNKKGLETQRAAISEELNRSQPFTPGIALAAILARIGHSPNTWLAGIVRLLL